MVGQFNAVSLCEESRGEPAWLLNTRPMKIEQKVLQTRLFANLKEPQVDGQFGSNSSAFTHSKKGPKMNRQRSFEKLAGDEESKNLVGEGQLKRRKGSPQELNSSSLEGLGHKKSNSLKKS